MTERANLAATLDGAPLSDEEARALWTRFSAHMDAHHDDAAGFARENGYVSVTPTFERGRAVLVVRATAAPPQKAPAPDPPARSGGRKGARRRQR